MKYIVILSAVICVALVSNVTVAQDTNWTNSSGDQEWTNDLNWSSGATVLGTNFVVGGMTANVSSAGVFSNRVVVDNGGAGDGTVYIATDADLTVGGQILMGNNNLGAGGINITVDGQLTLDATNAVFAIGTAGGGEGILDIGSTGTVENMSAGGWIIAGFGPGTNGTINVNGGTITVSNEQLGVGWNGMGTLNVYAGGVANADVVLNVGVNNAAAHGDILINDGTINAGGLNLGNNVGSGTLTIEDAGVFNLSGGFVQTPGSTITINGTGKFEFAASELADVEALINGNPDWIFSGTPSITGSLGSVIVTNAVALTGDFDGDGDVDGADFLKWQRDGLSASDLSDWQTNYGAPPISAVTAVPEPSSLLLFAVFALTLVFTSRKRLTSSLV